MKKDGITLESRGTETIYLCGDTIRRTVYQLPNRWQFYIKMDDEFIEVFHGSSYFYRRKIDTAYIIEYYDKTKEEYETWRGEGYNTEEVIKHFRQDGYDKENYVILTISTIENDWKKYDR